MREVQCLSWLLDFHLTAQRFPRSLEKDKASLCGWTTLKAQSSPVVLESKAGAQGGDTAQSHCKAPFAGVNSWLCILCPQPSTGAHSPPQVPTG